MQSSGNQRHAEGEAETTAAKAEGYAKGAYDYVAGTASNVMGAITGDTSQQASGKSISVLYPPRSCLLHSSHSSRQSAG